MVAPSVQQAPSVNQITSTPKVHRDSFKTIFLPPDPHLPFISCDLMRNTVSLYLLYLLEPVEIRWLEQTNSVSIVDPVSWGELLEREKNSAKIRCSIYTRRPGLSQKTVCGEWQEGRKMDLYNTVWTREEEKGRRKSEGERWWNVGMTRGWDWQYWVCSSGRSDLDQRSVITICFSVLLFFSLPASK